MATHRNSSLEGLTAQCPETSWLEALWHGNEEENGFSALPAFPGFHPC